MYCGNNSLNSELVSGRTTLGTRYGCLRKGIGKGMYMPYDPSYSQPYAPIDNTIVYCGNKNNLPLKYDRFGNLPECLQKGIGIGKKKRVGQGLDGGVSSKYVMHKNILMYILIWNIISIGVFCWLYFAKPKFIKDKEGKINWVKFSIFFSIFITILTIVLILLWKLS